MSAGADGCSATPPQHILSTGRRPCNTKLAIDIYRGGFRITFEKAALPHLPSAVLTRDLSEAELHEGVEEIWAEYGRLSAKLAGEHIAPGGGWRRKGGVPDEAGVTWGRRVRWLY